MTPPRCGKCGLVAPDLDAHFEEAEHWSDPDWDVYAARVAVELAEMSAGAANARLVDARNRLARLEMTDA